MFVDWVDASGRKRSWSSAVEADGPGGGWYEAEKLLPAAATKISVRFEAHGPGGPWMVCQVDRCNECQWVPSHRPEVITFREDSDVAAENVDALFELAGPLNGCYVWRAWNAATVGRMQWECWLDEHSRPRPTERPRTLDAADGAAPFSSDVKDPMVRCINTTKRLCAAARVLIDAHRHTLNGLRRLDARFTDQWVGVNVGNTASAGLGIASAVLLFTAPPLGVGLGIGSAVTGGLTFAGDSLADLALLTDLKRRLSQDAYDAFVVAELLREWMRARREMATSSPYGLTPPRREDTNLTDVTDMASGYGFSTDRMSLGEAVDSGLDAGAVANGVAMTGTRVADGLGKTIAGFSQLLGVASALISTGYMIRGWSTTKAGQSIVRHKIEELTLRVIQLQHLLASLDRLECAICADDAILSDTVRHCSHSLHCFHARCLKQHSRRYGVAGCPVCAGPLDPEPKLLAECSEVHSSLGSRRTEQHHTPQEALLARVCRGVGRRSLRRSKVRESHVAEATDCCVASCW